MASFASASTASLQTEPARQRLEGEACERESEQYSAEDLAGHDFWLTRNGHGTGFWDAGRWKAPPDPWPRLADLTRPSI